LKKNFLRKILKKSTENISFWLGHDTSKKGYEMVLKLTKNENLIKNIEQLKDSDFGSNKKSDSSYQTIHQEWEEIINENQKNIEQLYHRGIVSDWAECRTKMENDFTFEDEIYSLLVNWLEQIDWSNIEEVKILFKYIDLVSNGDYKANPLVLLKYHKRILTIITALIKQEDFYIEDKLHNGNFGELVNRLINLYFHHTSHSYNNKNHIIQYDIDRKEIAQIIPDFIKAFPENCSNLTMYILKNDSEDLVDICAELLHFYITNQIEKHYWFSSELFSLYQKPSDFIYKNSSTILKQAIRMSELSEAQITYLIDHILMFHLNIDSKERQVAHSVKHIHRLKEADFDEEIIVQREKDLEKFIDNFEEIYIKNWQTAVRRLAVSRPIFKSIELLIKAFPKHNIEQLIELFEEAKNYKNRPKVYSLKQKPTVVFKDLHFKYLVIEALMYNLQILKPAFDIQKFVQEYDKREIDIEEEGYQVIPEVKRYFKNLDIPVELLEKVTVLYQDSGLSGGSVFIYQLYPFWDPGAGDEVFKITNKAIEDLELLPNLKKIIGLENSNPSKKLVKAIEEKGIVLEKEDE